MVLQIRGRTEKDAQDPHSHFHQSVFVESDSVPDVKLARAKLKAYYGDDFDEKTIEIVEWRGWNAEAMRKDHLPVEKI